MLDDTKPKDRLVAAALRLAAERPWNDVSMHDIAEAARCTLADVRREFPSKGAILAAFTRKVDDALLERATKPKADAPARDRLFEVIMSRFDVLAPYKAGLKSIAAAKPMDLAIIKKAFASQAWMLHAAGIATDGPLGPVRVAGLASVYASVLETWLADDDPGLAKTMAALDRRLKRGEQAMDTLTGLCKTACSIAERLTGLGRKESGKAASTASPATDPTDNEPLGYGRP